MRCLILLATGLLLAAPMTAFAADPDDVSGFYDGTAACPGGEVQIMLNLDLAPDDTVAGRLTVVPLKGAKIARGEYDVEGTINGDDWLALKGAGKIAFAGAWFDADSDEEPSILGALADSGCKDFDLTRQPPVGPV